LWRASYSSTEPGPTQGGAVEVVVGGVVVGGGVVVVAGGSVVVVGGNVVVVGQGVEVPGTMHGCTSNTANLGA
jgi:hypothetical protein